MNYDIVIPEFDHQPDQDEECIIVKSGNRQEKIRLHERDRAGVYEDYYITDMNEPDDKDMEKLEQYDFNTLISVAALGFEDIPPKAFLNAFNLIQNGGWIAFNIKDRFLTDKDDTGYKDIIADIREDNLDILRKKRYRHRLSLSGKELYYIAIIGRKTADVNLSEVDIR